MFIISGFDYWSWSPSSCRWASTSSNTTRQGSRANVCGNEDLAAWQPSGSIFFSDSEWGLERSTLHSPLSTPTWSCWPLQGVLWRRWGGPGSPRLSSSQTTARPGCWPDTCWWWPCSARTPARSPPSPSSTSELFSLAVRGPLGHNYVIHSYSH